MENLSGIDIVRFDVTIKLVGALDKMVAALFSKVAITPLAELEAETIKLVELVKDDDRLQDKSKAMLRQNIAMLQCLIRFRDDLIMNVPQAKRCWDDSQDIRNLLKELGDNGMSVRIFGTE